MSDTSSLPGMTQAFAWTVANDLNCFELSNSQATHSQENHRMNLQTVEHGIQGTAASLPAKPAANVILAASTLGEQCMTR